jgi:hypothetical protein
MNSASFPKRHHILPRFLLEGFASRHKKSQCRAWVIPKSKPAYETNVRNISVEQYFYGRNTENAEDALGRLESRTAPIVVRLREGGSLNVDDAATLSEFVATMIVRTRHLRDEVQSAVSRLATRMSGSLNSEMAKVMANDYFRKRPGEMEIHIRKALGLSDDHPVPEGAKELALAALALVPAQSLFSPTYVDTLRHGLLSVLNGIDVGDIQNRTLRQSLDGSSPMRRFEGFSWDKLRGADRLILGDTGPVALGRDGSLHSPLTLGEECNSIIVPLSPSILLVGHAGPMPPLLSWKEINTGVAELSGEYCVASSRDDDQRYLSNLIGTRSELLSDAAAQEMVDQTWKQISE